MEQDYLTGSRIQIAFDMDTKKLKDIYSSQSGKDYTNAYSEIRSTMTNMGYEHAQGSVYHSLEAKSRMDVLTDTKQLMKELPWFGECVNKLDYGQLPVIHDLMPEVKEQKEQTLAYKMEKDMPDGDEVLKQMFKESSRPKKKDRFWNKER